MRTFLNSRTSLRVAIDGLPGRNPKSLIAQRRARVWDDNETLVHTVQKENFAGAERLHERLVAACLPIRPHPAYERAALAQIRHPEARNLDNFRTWLDLVPESRNPHRVEGGPFTKTRDLLFRSGSPAEEIPLLSLFCLVCAEKGYGKLVWKDIVALLVKFEEPGNAVAFLRSFGEARLRYYTKHQPHHAAWIASRQREALIRTCCTAGWFGEAVDLIKDSTSLEIGSAARHLLQVLDNKNQKDLISVVLAHLPPKISLAFSTKAIIDGWTSPLPRAAVAAQLRHIKNLISRRALIASRLPASHLHAFLAQYEAAKGYSYGLAALRRRALLKSDNTSYIWLTKELFYLQQMGRHADVISLFYANFSSFIIPRKEGLILHQLAVLSANPQLLSHSVPLKLRIKPSDAWLIWNALIRISIQLPPETRLETLFSLRHCFGQYAAALPDHVFRATPTSYTAVFRSLVWAYGQLGDVASAFSAAHDITLIGKTHETNVVLLDELVTIHARRGDFDSVTELLDSLDSFGPRVQPYGRVIDAFLQARLVDLALEIETRMKEKCEYIPGANWRLDRSISRLDKFRKKEVVETEDEVSWWPDMTVSIEQ
ncbi:hypothetical protein MIND_00141900 [Mycena indigotica]|uniref:Uncharacterized protein n=1 Tax=Mycena indigotica TaxID=2126181 RepID=A0A8H6WIK6_9AGAR|nr:uncharacterized protein MIND_00141900 [Mycena indigotica]KAF7316233.1 hypothetical protein MIND_00141900 [Mycena indigotica]